MARELLNEAERKRINAAIEDAEKMTRGEIVPVVLRSSDSYPGARWRLAVAFAFLVSGVVWLAVPMLEPLYVWMALLPLIGVGHVVAAWPPLLRLSLKQIEVEEEVRQRAVEQFFELALHGTTERSGVLVFVSLLEHRIEVLADRGIDEVAPDDFWNEVVANLGRDIKSKGVADAMVTALGQVGELLGQHFPSTGENRNELPDEVVTDS